MTTLKELEQRIATIEGRNKKVEKDKAWEVSWTSLPFIKKTWEKYH